MTEQDGYTLVEMMMVVAIGAILLGIGVPTLNGFVSGRQIDAQVSALAASLRLARSEAVHRGARVSICRSSNGVDCSTQASQRDWSSGWLVFEDQGARGVVDADDVVLSTQAPQPEGHRILAGGAGLYVISYLPSGIAVGVQNNLRFLARGASEAQRVMCISITGAVRMTKSAAC